MHALAVLTFWVLAGSIAVQTLLTLCFLKALRRSSPRPAPDEACPKAAVVLCLRGPDPFLEASVRALLEQDYPCYDVRVVVDSHEDPAWQTVQRVVTQYGATNVRIEALVQRRSTCSLKCSALVQAVGSLDESYGVLALLDADTLPHRTWLRELVAPLAEPGVGAATGNRWYMPANASWGSLVRYLWNAAAVVQMYCYGIPWGGTLAVKMQAVREAGLLDRWGRAFCEDTMVYHALRRRRLRVRFVPSLMMVNRESCTIRGFLQWVRRQLLAARLYHPGWPAVVVHGVATPLLLAAAAAMLLGAVVSGHTAAAAWLGAGLLAYALPLLGLLVLLERGVRRIVAARSEPTGWLCAATLSRLVPGILLTQTVYFGALAAAMLLRTVAWRGVDYRIDASWQIRLLEYRPYGAAPHPGDTVSL